MQGDELEDKCYNPILEEHLSRSLYDRNTDYNEELNKTRR
jgi:hypothetical protein